MDSYSEKILSVVKENEEWMNDNGVKVIGHAIHGSMRHGFPKPTSDIDVLFLVEDDPKLTKIGKISVKGNKDGAFLVDVWRNLQLDEMRRYSGLICSVRQCSLMLEHLRDEFRSIEDLKTPKTWKSEGKDKSGTRTDRINETTWIMTALLAMKDDGVDLPKNLATELDYTLDLFHKFRRHEKISNSRISDWVNTR